MLDARAAAAVKVAGTAVGAGGRSHRGGCRHQVYRRDHLAGAFRPVQFFPFINRVTGFEGVFAVDGAVCVAGQAVNIFLYREIEAVVGVAVADVATGTARPVGVNRDAVVVDDIVLAIQLTVFGGIVPGPVSGPHHILCCGGMAGEAFGRHLWGGFKRVSLKKGRMIRSRVVFISRYRAGDHRDQDDQHRQDAEKFNQVPFPFHEKIRSL